MSCYLAVVEILSNDGGVKGQIRLVVKHDNFFWIFIEGRHYLTLLNTLHALLDDSIIIVIQKRGPSLKSRLHMHCATFSSTTTNLVSIHQRSIPPVFRINAPTSILLLCKRFSIHDFALRTMNTRTWFLQLLIWLCPIEDQYWCFMSRRFAPPQESPNSRL